MLGSSTILPMLATLPCHMAHPTWDSWAHLSVFASVCVFSMSYGSKDKLWLGQNLLKVVIIVISKFFHLSFGRMSTRKWLYLIPYSIPLFKIEVVFLATQVHDDLANWGLLHKKSARKYQNNVFKVHYVYSNELTFFTWSERRHIGSNFQLLI